MKTRNSAIADKPRATHLRKMCNGVRGRPSKTRPPHAEFSHSRSNVRVCINRGDPPKLGFARSTPPSDRGVADLKQPPIPAHTSNAVVLCRRVA